MHLIFKRPNPCGTLIYCLHCAKFSCIVLSFQCVNIINVCVELTSQSRNFAFLNIPYIKTFQHTGRHLFSNHYISELFNFYNCFSHLVVMFSRIQMGCCHRKN